jgi:hypothetical protein
MAPEPPGIQPGQAWGHLTLRQDLGHGPRGLVYRAWDPELGQEVVLAIAPDVRTDPAGRDVIHEARVLAKLRHPNLAVVFGAERRDGRAGVWLELVDGETLEATLAHVGRFSAREAALIGIDICSALGAMHAAGILHRDLTTRQVIRDRNGRIVVIPFGAGRDTPLASGPARLVPFAEPAPVGGWPESAHGGRPGVAGDIYRVGALLHRLVAGPAPPADPRRPLADVRSDLPLGFIRAVERALAAEPAERHESAFALESALATLWTPAAQRVDQHAARRRPARVLLGAGAAAAIVALGMSLGAWLTRQPPAAEVRFDIQPEGEAVESVAFARDGASVAYTSGGRLRIRHLDDESSTPLEPPLGARNPFFSADGQWVYYFGGVSLWRVRPAGGEPQAVASARRPSTGAAGPNGTVVYSIENGMALMVIPPGGKARVLRQQVPGVRTVLRWPSLPGDGTRVLYSATDARTGRRALYLGDVSAPPDSTDRMLLELESNAIAIGAHVFCVADGVLSVRRLDVDGGRFVGEPLVLARRIATDPYSDGQVEFSASATGSVAYVAGMPSTRTLRVVDALGRAVTDLATGDIRDLRVSPSGGTVAYEQVDETTGGRDIWVVDAGGGTPVRVSRHPAHDVAPTWTPDESRLYYLSHRRPQPVLVSAPAGGGPETVHFAFDGPAIPHEITRDGKAMLYQQEGQESGWDLWLRPLQGGAPAALVRGPAGEQSPALSPDGRWLAYSSPESQGRQVYVEPMPSDGRRWRVSVTHGREPVWAPDGRTLYYHGHERMLVAIPVGGEGRAFSHGDERPLFTIPLRGYDVRYHFGVLPGADRFVVSVPPALMPPVPATVVLNARLP